MIDGTSGMNDDAFGHSSAYGSLWQAQRRQDYYYSEEMSRMFLASNIVYIAGQSRSSIASGFSLK